MALDAEDTAVSTAMHRGRDWKGYAAMVGAVAALITAWFHRQPEDAAKASYIDVTAAILASQEAERKNHEDIVALSASFENYMKEHTVIETSAPLPIDAGSPKEAFLAMPTPPPVPKVVHVVASPSAAAPVPSIAPLSLPKRPKDVNAYSW